MNKLFVALLLFLCLPPIPAHAVEPEPQTWAEFKSVYRKTFGIGDEAERAAAFAANKKHIDAANAENSSENGEKPFGVTQNADSAPAVFAKQHMGYKPLPLDKLKRAVKKHGTAPEVHSFTGPPISVDWRQKPNIVGAVRDQGACGSCWAFSVVEGVEAAWAVRNPNSHPLLSTQQLVSCDHIDAGCGGGDQIDAFNYIYGAGLMQESHYPYRSGQTGANGVCGYSKASAQPVLKAIHYAVPPCQTRNCTGQVKYEDQLKAQLATGGPMSVCVNASMWQHYRGGIVTASGCPGNYGDIDHCVLLVGYDDAQKVWILRNQWGPSWGEHGDIRLAMGANTCGMLNSPTLVVPTTAP